MCQEVDPRGDDLDISQEINWTGLNAFTENIKSQQVKATTQRKGWEEPSWVAYLV